MVEWLRHVRRNLYEFPELKWEEEQTSTIIRQGLHWIGIAHEYPIAKHGVVAILDNLEAHVLALRWYMDALPIQGTVRRRRSQSDTQRGSVGRCVDNLRRPCSTCLRA